MKVRWRIAGGACLAFAAAICVTVATRIDPPLEGMSADVFDTPDWTGRVTHRPFQLPSAASVVALWNGSPPSTFSVTWSGSLIVLWQGTYTFATMSDDGSYVLVDGQTVVDNGGRHAATRVVAPLRLRRGAHSVVVKYFQDGGPFAFDFEITHGPNATTVPPWALLPPRVSFGRAVWRIALDRAALPSAIVAVTAASIGAVAAFWPWLAMLTAAAFQDRTRATVRAIVIGSLVLNTAQVWWGLPGYGWAGDELTPPAVYDGLERWFSGGWFSRWPPMHFYVLSAAYAPLLIAERIGRFSLPGRWQYSTLLFVSRLVSLAAAAATVWLVDALASRMFSRRAGVFAALAFALLLPFVYYAKAANVDGPLTFWTALSLLFFVRVLQTLSMRDYVSFAAAAAVAVCTKDQAYALYIAPPFFIAAAEWRRARSLRTEHPAAGAFLNRKMAIAGTSAAVIFAACHNLLFNFTGFVSHVKYITGAGSEGYRMFQPTVSGQLRLLSTTVWLDRISWGAPLFAASAAGLVAAVSNRHTRAIALTMAAIIAVYYAGFIGVILYSYDRFLLPVFVVQAAFIGYACDRLLEGVPRRAATAVLGAVFAYSCLYASTVNVLMARDSRYSIERWMAGHVKPGELVATMFDVQYLPRLDGVSWTIARSADELERSRATYFLLNADYARAMNPSSEPAQLVKGLEDGTLGYLLAVRCRAPAPWPWLPAGHPDLVGSRADLPVFTVFRNVNPTMAIYQRRLSGRLNP